MASKPRPVKKRVPTQRGGKNKGNWVSWGSETKTDACQNQNQGRLWAALVMGGSSRGERELFWQ